MWIPESAVKTLVENISDIIKNKPHLIGADVRKNLEELKTQLEKLRLLMPNFFDADDHDGRKNLRETVAEIKEALNMCEDAVDNVYSSGSGPIRRSTLNRMLLTDTKSRRNQIGKAKRQIKEAGDQVKNVNEEIVRRGYHVLHKRDDDQAIGYWQKNSTAPKVGLIGRDGAAAELIGLLTTGVEHLEVISIVGMLGIEKTVLVDRVFGDQEVQSQYEHNRAMIQSVSTNYYRRQLLLSILAYFTLSSAGASEMDVNRLKKHVRQQLEGKQYLIVLDGVRRKIDWDILKDAFPDNRGKRCRVLITTRLDDGVTRNPTFECVYRMDFLSLESSRELLRWRVFGENNCPVELQEYERDVVLKCDGLPLALLSVATMLMKDLNKVVWWKKVVGLLRDYRARDVEHASMPVEMTYIHLPNHLKPCFLYLVVSHTKFGISARKLFSLWISEGFVLPDESGSRNLEDIADQYLEELVYRNFVMEIGRRSNGRIKFCIVSPMFYKFGEIEASKENLIKKQKDININMLDKCRRISIISNTMELLSGNHITGNGTRSLFFVGEKVDVDQNTIAFIPMSFKHLKVLDAASLFSPCIPDQLWSLVLLKYLAISGPIISLPSALSDLWSLQTLIVKTTSPTLEVIADIWEMPHFRHLHTNASTTFPCPVTSEKTDSCLQTLRYISPECCKREVFHRTEKLRKIGISGELTEFFMYILLEYMYELDHLKNLKLLNWNNSTSLPHNISGLKQLTKLTLSNTRLDWKEMRKLGEMENLEALKIKEYAFVGKQWKIENGGFLCLKHLHIGRTNLMAWEASADHFPTLKRLKIMYCDRLYRVPHGLADILSLQSVSLHNSTGPGVTYSLKRIRLLKFLQRKHVNESKIFQISMYPQED